MRKLPSPDDRVNVPGRGLVFIYYELTFNHVAVDDIVEVDGERYLIVGIEAPDAPIGIVVRKLQDA